MKEIIIKLYRRDTGKVECRTGGMQDWRDAGNEGCKKGGMQESRGASTEGCRKGDIQEMRDANLVLIWPKVQSSKLQFCLVSLVKCFVWRNMKHTKRNFECYNQFHETPNKEHFFAKYETRFA